MRHGKESNQPASKKPTSVTHELKLVCAKIADVDAVWRFSALRKSSSPSPLKRAA